MPASAQSGSSAGDCANPRLLLRTAAAAADARNVRRLNGCFVIIATQVYVELWRIGPGMRLQDRAGRDARLKRKQAPASFTYVLAKAVEAQRLECELPVRPRCGRDQPDWDSRHESGAAF